MVPLEDLFPTLHSLLVVNQWRESISTSTMYLGVVLTDELT